MLPIVIEKQIREKRHTKPVPEIFGRITANLFDLFGNLSTFCCFIATRNVQHFATLLQSNGCSSTQLICERFKWTHSMLCISELQTVCFWVFAPIICTFLSWQSQLFDALFRSISRTTHTLISNAMQRCTNISARIVSVKWELLRVSFASIGRH